MIEAQKQKLPTTTREINELIREEQRTEREKEKKKQTERERERERERENILRLAEPESRYARG